MLIAYNNQVTNDVIYVSVSTSEIATIEGADTVDAFERGVDVVGGKITYVFGNLSLPSVIDDDNSAFVAEQILNLPR